MTLYLLSQIMLINGYSMQFRERFIWSNKKFKRPHWAGSIVCIVQNDIVKRVKGIVLPISTNSKRCPKRPFVIPYPLNIDSYKMSNDKGHIMALELGGPNNKCNIVMQPNQWQRFGYWRQMEKQIRELALSIYKLEYPLCADEAIDMLKPENLLEIQYNLKYKLDKQLKNITGKLSWGVHAITFYIGVNEKAKFNKPIMCVMNSNVTL